MPHEEDLSQEQQERAPVSQQDLAVLSDAAPPSANQGLTPADIDRVEKIKSVYRVLGEILDEKKKEKLRLEKEELSRTRWSFRAAYVTIIAWLVYFAVRPNALSNKVLLAMSISMAVVMLMALYNIFAIRRWKRRSARERMEEEGGKVAGQLVVNNMRLLSVAGKPILKEVEVRLKSEGALVDARFKLVSNFLKNISPGAVALAALFGLSKLPESNYVAGSLIAILGAGIVLINVFAEVGIQPHVIEMREYITLLEQAQADSGDGLNPVSSQHLPEVR